MRLPENWINLGASRSLVLCVYVAVVGNHGGFPNVVGVPLVQVDQMMFEIARAMATHRCAVARVVGFLPIAAGEPKRYRQRPFPCREPN